MPTTKLKLHEYYQFDIELNGLINQSNGEVLQTGLLKEKLNLITKYWLTDLAKTVSLEKEAIENLKTDLVKKYGEEDKDGNISLPIYFPEEKNDEGEITKQAMLNPKYVEFEKEFSTLLQEEKELTHHEFKLEDFKNIETTNNYNVFYKLIKVD